MSRKIQNQVNQKREQYIRIAPFRNVACDIIHKSRPPICVLH